MSIEKGGSTVSSRPTFMERARAAMVGRGPACGVRAVLATLEPGYRSEVEEAIADLTIEGNTISRILAEDEVRLAGGTISRHRRGDCSCKKDAA